MIPDPFLGGVYYCSKIGDTWIYVEVWNHQVLGTNISDPLVVEGILIADTIYSLLSHNCPPFSGSDSLVRGCCTQNHD